MAVWCAAPAADPSLAIPCAAATSADAAASAAAAAANRLQLDGADAWGLEPELQGAELFRWRTGSYLLTRTYEWTNRKKDPCAFSTRFTALIREKAPSRA
jgi:hypothetical protein